MVMMVMMVVTVVMALMLVMALVVVVDVGGCWLLSHVMISPGGGWSGVDWAGPVEPRESLQQRPQPTI